MAKHVLYALQGICYQYSPFACLAFPSLTTDEKNGKQQRHSKNKAFASTTQHIQYLYFRQALLWPSCGVVAPGLLLLLGGGGGGCHGRLGRLLLHLLLVGLD